MLAASVLSKQLFMTLVTLAAVTSSLGQSADDASEETLRTVSAVQFPFSCVSIYTLRGGDPVSGCGAESFYG